MVCCICIVKWFCWWLMMLRLLNCPIRFPPGVLIGVDSWLLGIDGEFIIGIAIWFMPIGIAMLFIIGIAIGIAIGIPVDELLPIDCRFGMLIIGKFIIDCCCCPGCRCCWPFLLLMFWFRFIIFGMLPPIPFIDGGSIGVAFVPIDVTDDIGTELLPFSIERLNCISRLFAFSIRWFISKLF